MIEHFEAVDSYYDKTTPPKKGQQKVKRVVMILREEEVSALEDIFKRFSLKNFFTQFFYFLDISDFRSEFPFLFLSYEGDSSLSFGEM